ncbi:MAG: Ldh family oxidoreductase, partial [Candidatus Binatia bacterium]
MPKIDHQQLLEFCNQLLSAGGMAKDDADLVAELLVRGELRGYAGHGVIRVNPYLNWIKDGTYQIEDKPVIEREGKITAVVDGKHYIGQVAAHFAMELAIEKANTHGAGIVCLRRAGHTGRLADYMEMATDRGMIGIAAASVGSAVTALYGAMQPITGTNPMAFGIPARGGRHI